MELSNKSGWTSSHSPEQSPAERGAGRAADIVGFGCCICADFAPPSSSVSLLTSAGVSSSELRRRSSTASSGARAAAAAAAAEGRPSSSCQRPLTLRNSREVSSVEGRKKIKGSSVSIVFTKAGKRHYCGLYL